MLIVLNEKYLMQHLFLYHGFQFKYEFKEFEVKSYANPKIE